ncbi:MAG: A/G-specific adenine glycosylase [Bdellovibrionales bacterium]|nr:A/G-specific adenine glycosylase [Bdellovibrionales bacterium]
MSAIHRKLLAWYRNHARTLPWRENRDPYRVWLSEIMLQQTRVEAVIPHYQRFLSHFSTVEDLASAPEEKVLNLWAGLGYYSRARNLHAAARMVMACHGGRFPTDYGSLLALPGVGHYTASAVASIAGDAALAAVDGNLERVISRLLALRKNPKKEGRQIVAGFAQSLAELGEAGSVNQAFIDLASGVCLPKNPRCDSCPLNAACAARKEGVQGEIPVRMPKGEKIHLRGEGALLLVRGEILLARRPKGAWLEGMLDIPWWTEPARKLPWKPGREHRQVRHITKHRIDFLVRGYELSRKPRNLEKVLGRHGEQFEWVRVEDLAGIQLPRPTERAIEGILR